MASILVTGANGFIGSALVRRLNRDGVHTVVSGVRTVRLGRDDHGCQFEMGDLTQISDWTDGLSGVSTVVHTAARVHRMNDQNPNPLAAFRRANTTATLAIAEQAAAVGVRRFIFLSTVKVLGEESMPGRPFRADSPAAPMNPYAVSKHEAEGGLRDIARKSAMCVVIVRPPLVYGSGAGGNFRQMVRWIAHGVPLPLAGIRNLRSLVSVDNLVDLLALCAEHPRASNRTFMVSDGEDLSTPDLLRRVGVALRRPARLFWAPRVIVEAIGALSAQGEGVRRLFETLQVDIEKTRSELSWTPPVGINKALESAIRFGSD